jgi:hypothetical protein
MICPKCEYEYVDGITECPDCKIELVTKEMFEGNLVNPEDYVVVYTSGDELEIEMLKENLLGAEIESLIYSQRDRSFPVVGNLSVIRLLVHKDNAADAIEIINDIQNSNSGDEE